MLSLTHTLISLPFGIYFDNPLLAFLGAAFFHLFCDTLLHWNIVPGHYKTYPYTLVSLDVLSGLVAAWLALGENFFSPTMLAAIVGGNAPDLLQGLWDITKHQFSSKYTAWPDWLSDVHFKIQQETAVVRRGLAWQVLLSTLALGLVYL